VRLGESEEHTGPYLAPAEMLVRPAAPPVAA
jgi:hypothetical protein